MDVQKEIKKNWMAGSLYAEHWKYECVPEFTFLITDSLTVTERRSSEILDADEGKGRRRGIWKNQVSPYSRILERLYQILLPFPKLETVYFSKTLILSRMHYGGQ
jgi:hypothetical protein